MIYSNFCGVAVVMDVGAKTFADVSGFGWGQAFDRVFQNGVKWYLEGMRDFL